MLINLILKKDNSAYISFYNALLHEGYKDLAALLHGGIPVVSSNNGKDSGGGITSYGLYPLYPLLHWCSFVLTMDGVCLRADQSLKNYCCFPV